MEHFCLFDIGNLRVKNEDIQAKYTNSGPNNLGSLLLDRPLSLPVR